MNQTIFFSFLSVYVLSLVSLVESYVASSLRLRSFSLIRPQKLIISQNPAFKQLLLHLDNDRVSLSKCEQYAEKPICVRIGGKLFGPIIRYINNFIVGILFSIILRIRNKFTIKRGEILLNEVFHRPKGSGLLTVSNHQSMLDDPGIWAAALPFWRLSPEKLRWYRTYFCKCTCKICL